MPEVLDCPTKREEQIPLREVQTIYHEPTPALTGVPGDTPAELLSSSKYQVLGKLGEGGMGAVYKVRHTFLDRVMALKVMHPEAIGSRQARARFLAEMRAVGQLENRHIVPARDADQVGDLLVLIMDFVEGISLDRLLAEQGRLPLALACRCVRQAALGLQHAHEKGMVHRDIKPSNLLLTRLDSEVKILDFGLVQLPREQAGAGRTQARMFMGTPRYVSPEQSADARGADRRSDIYSLGCTLYHLLAGRTPFEVETPLDAILAHGQKEPPVLTEIPATLWSVLAKMLAKSPEQRYQTALEVAQALEPFTTAAPARAAGSSRTKTEGRTMKQSQRRGKLPRPPRRKPWGSLGWLLGVLLVLGGLAWSILNWGPNWLDRVESKALAEPGPSQEMTNSIGMQF